MANIIDQWRDELMSRLQKNDEWDSWLEKFLESTTDADRIASIYELPFIDDVIEIAMTESEKCPDDSTEMREMGNDEFKQKNYAEAFEYYTQSILKAPHGSEELALGYANRSAVTKEEKKFEMCLKDIELALAHGYPAKLKHKIFERQGRCYYDLGLYENAAESFEKAIFKLPKAKLKNEEMENREKKLNALLECCKDKTNSTEKKLSKSPKYNEPIPEITEIQSEKFPCASESFSLGYTEEKGRYPVAESDIKIGEVLIVEEPYCSVVNSKYFATHCHFCCQRAEVPVPCTECTNIVYCSTKCQEASWEASHSFECKILHLINELDSDIPHLALRMVIKATFDYLKEFKEKHQNGDNEEDPCSVGFNEEGVYDSHDYWAVYNLVNHTYDRKFPDLFRRTVMAVYLLKCLEKTEYFPDEEENCSDSDRIEVGGHILRHLQMLPCNAHEVTEFLIEPGELLSSNSMGIGSAIYATLSLFNHSCDPNVVRHSYGDKCVVRAIHKIKKGEEIIDSYSIIYPTMAKDKRISELRRQYYFDCECMPCQNDWPMYEELMNQLPSFKCDKCDTPIGALQGEGAEDNQNECENCGHSNHVAKKVQHIVSFESDFHTVFNNVLSGDMTKHSLNFLIEHQTRLENWMSRPWQDINKCQEAIKQCYSFQANHFTITTKKK